MITSKQLIDTITKQSPHLSWLDTGLIYLTKHGSHAYGTNVPSSDLDLRGICIPPLKYFFGIQHRFEEAQLKEPDTTIFSLQKFFKLASDCNPNALEIIFTEPEDHLFISPIGQKVLEMRNHFLSQKAKHTFSGYAMSQLQRINRHYRWLKNPMKEKPSRKEFHLPEKPSIPIDQLKAVQSMIDKKIDEIEWRDLENLEKSERIAIKAEFYRKLVEITQWSDSVIDEKIFQSICFSLGFETNFIEYLDKERQYKSKLKDYESYQIWLKERNPARAELEAKFGYDCKNSLHLCRLYLMCKELLQEGKVQVKRPDASFLLEIRDGKLSYEELIEWAKDKDQELEQIKEQSKLPHSVDHNLIDQICQNLITEHLL